MKQFWKEIKKPLWRLLCLIIPLCSAGLLGLKNLDYYQGRVDALNDTLSFLDTIEVKGVDLDALGVLANHLIACDAYGITPKYSDKELDFLEGLANNTLHRINTLEVKEVDLEKEVNDYGYHYDYVSLADRKELVDFAKHFFELGLKARKEKVDDSKMY